MKQKYQNNHYKLALLIAVSLLLVAFSSDVVLHFLKGKQASTEQADLSIRQETLCEKVPECITPATAGIEEKINMMKELQGLIINDLKVKIVGKWTGEATSPWSKPFKVSFEFNNDGTYATKPIGAKKGYWPSSALYWGLDGGSSTYLFSYVKADGLVAGHMGIRFDTGEENEGTLDNVIIRGNQLTFDLYSNEHGPVRYILIKE